jgi:glycosyltransferase involved in cell wall biosynthesis
MFIKTHFAFYRALKTKSKIYHFHDPELMISGILLKILGKKVVFDSHENVSSQIENKTWLGGVFLRKIIKNGYRLIEKFSILFFDKVISVTPEIVEFLAPKKGVLIRNYPIISLIESQGTKRVDPKKTVFFYAGGLTQIRGIKEVCDAIQLVEGDVELKLLGRWESEEYKVECLTGKERINYLGIVPLEQVYPLMKTADVGLAVLLPAKNHFNSMPIKIFEYVTCEMPVIMSNFPYWIDLFGNYSKFADPLSIESVSTQMQWFIDNKQEAIAMGLRGKKEVKEKYSWESEAKTLVKMYEELS